MKNGIIFLVGLVAVILVFSFLSKSIILYNDDRLPEEVTIYRMEVIKEFIKNKGISCQDLPEENMTARKLYSLICDEYNLDCSPDFKGTDAWGRDLLYVFNTVSDSGKTLFSKGKSEDDDNDDLTVSLCKNQE